MKHRWFKTKHRWFKTKHRWFKTKHRWSETKHRWFETKHPCFKTKHRWFKNEASMVRNEVSMVPDEASMLQKRSIDDGSEHRTVLVLSSGCNRRGSPESPSSASSLERPFQSEQTRNEKQQLLKAATPAFGRERPYQNDEGRGARRRQQTESRRLDDSSQSILSISPSRRSGFAHGGKSRSAIVQRDSVRPAAIAGSDLQRLVLQTGHFGDLSGPGQRRREPRNRRRQLLGMCARHILQLPR